MRKLLVAALAVSTVSTPALANHFEGLRLEARLGYDNVHRDKVDEFGYDDEYTYDLNVGPASDSGVTYGAGVGYDFALINKVTLGAEANIAFSNINSDVLSPYFDNDNAVYKSDREFELSARLGYKLSDKALLFVKGGFANMNYRYEDLDDGYQSSHNERSGWTVGGGLEAAVSKNVYAKLEYRYSDYGNNGAYEDSDLDGYWEIYSDKQRRHNVLMAVGYRF